MNMTRGEAIEQLPRSYQVAIETVTRAALEPSSLSTEDFDFEQRLRDEGYVDREIICSIWSQLTSSPYLRRILNDYFTYYQFCRTHLSLKKDAPNSRPVEPPYMGKIVAISKVGGHHHRYTRQAA